jgi:hypothetical protein
MTRNHQDIIDIARYLEQQCSKYEIMQLLRPRLKSPKNTEEEDAILEGSID